MLDLSLTGIAQSLDRLILLAWIPWRPSQNSMVGRGASTLQTGSWITFPRDFCTSSRLFTVSLARGNSEFIFYIFHEWSQKTTSSIILMSDCKNSKVDIFARALVSQNWKKMDTSSGQVRGLKTIPIARVNRKKERRRFVMRDIETKRGRINMMILRDRQVQVCFPSMALRMLFCACCILLAVTLAFSSKTGEFVFKFSNSKN